MAKLTTRDTYKIMGLMAALLLIAAYLLLSVIANNFADPNGAREYLRSEGYGSPRQVPNAPFETVGTPSCRGLGRNIYKFTASRPHGDGHRETVYVCKNLFGWQTHLPEDF